MIFPIYRANLAQEKLNPNDISQFLGQKKAGRPLFVPVFPWNETPGYHYSNLRIITLSTMLYRCCG